MNALNQIERIKIKLRLAKNTDSFFEVFGASSHRYILNAPLNVKELNDFEKKYSITLPNSYKIFLSEIGNGGIEYKNSVVGNSGAGPDYGIFKLGHLHHFIVEPSSKYLEKEPFFNESTTQEEWDKIYDEMDDNISDEDYDKVVAKAYAGILKIGFSGCSGYLGIILNGKNKDRVVYTSDEIEYCPCFSKETNFLDWYENWLDEIISGKSIKQHGGTIESEESCINRFLSAKEPYWTFISLAYLRSFEKLNDTSISVLHQFYEKENNEKVKLYLLNLLTKFDYFNVKKEIAKLAKINPMEFLRNIHLYSKEKSVEWLNEIEKIKSADNAELLEYIEFITNPDIKSTRRVDGTSTNL